MAAEPLKEQELPSAPGPSSGQRDVKLASSEAMAPQAAAPLPVAAPRASSKPSQAQPSGVATPERDSSRLSIPEASSDAGEVEEFFERGAVGAYEGGPARARQELDADPWEPPVISAQQLERRARLQRLVAGIVGSLALLSLVAFASRAFRASEAEQAEAPKPVATTLGAARVQPLTVSPRPADAQPSLASSVEEPTSPGAPSPSPPAEPAAVAAPRGVSGRAPSRAANTPSNRPAAARPPAVRGAPRAPQPPAPAVRAPVPSGESPPSPVAEPPPTASFPVDPP